MTNKRREASATLASPQLAIRGRRKQEASPQALTAEQVIWNGRAIRMVFNKRLRARRSIPALGASPQTVFQRGLN